MLLIGIGSCLIVIRILEGSQVVWALAVPAVRARVSVCDGNGEEEEGELV